MRSLQKEGRIIFYITVIPVFLGFLSGCSSSNSSTESGTCHFSSGAYEYGLHMSLDLDPATFEDGSEQRSFWGSTYITVDGDSFSFRGGENDAWEIEGSCLDGQDDPVNITLHNDCSSDYITSASSNMIDAASDGAEDGLHVIETYIIHWTCGRETSVIAQERWDLFLQ